MTEAAINIRYGTLDDVDQITPLFEQYRQFYGVAAAPEQSRKFLEQRFFLGESHIIVAEQEGNIIGFTQLYPSFSSMTLERLWILNDLFVDARYRRASIGRQLLGAAAKHGKKNGAKQLFIEGAVANHKACSLYESFGFIKNDEYYYYHFPLTK